jgi:type IV pilus assembly protein PilA
MENVLVNVYKTHLKGAIMSNRLRKSKKGFTLIELVVVIAILGILAAILVPVIGGFITRANTARDQANARNLYNCYAMALATGATDAVTGTGLTAVPTSVAGLFGSLPSGISYSVTVTAGSVRSVTYNGQTYSRS